MLIRKTDRSSVSVAGPGDNHVMAVPAFELSTPRGAACSYLQELKRKVSVLVDLQQAIHGLPRSSKPGQVRAALTQVLERARQFYPESTREVSPGFITNLDRSVQSLFEKNELAD